MHAVGPVAHGYSSSVPHFRWDGITANSSHRESGRSEASSLFFLIKKRTLSTFLVWEYVFTNGDPCVTTPGKELHHDFSVLYGSYLSMIGGGRGY